jgi:hypothetical protein
MVKKGILTLFLCAATALAAGIDGKWTSATQVGDADGKTYPHTSTFTFKNDHGLLTGTVVQVSAAPWMRDYTGQIYDVKDGKVEGDKFSFKVTQETKNGERTAVYEGAIEGDHLKGILKYRGVGQTRPFDAQRTK